MKTWISAGVGAALALAGMEAGRWLFDPPPAQAQQSGYRACIIARQETLDTNASGDIARITADHSITIPPGWEPIGGGGLGGMWIGTVVLCRR